MLQNRKQQRLVLSGDEVVELQGVAVHQLVGVNGRSARRFIDVVGGDSKRSLIRRSSRLTVGRFSLDGYDIVVAPPFNPASFVQLVLYALQIDIARYASKAIGGVRVDNDRSDLFLVLMSALLVAETEELVRGHISKSYVRLERRVLSLRGSVRFERSFGRHPSSGLDCIIHEQTTDDLLNQLILSGLTSAASVLTSSEHSSAVMTQLAIWRQLARVMIPNSIDFEIANRRLGRLTEHYKPAIALARALTLGLAPTDLVAAGDTGLNNLEFALPVLYEKFLLRFLTPVAEKIGLELDFKHRFAEALTDADGLPYRRVEPDIVVLRGGVPVGVVDAKFKPRYVNPSSSNRELPDGKVTNEDIYQLFFYQARLQSMVGLPYVPRAVILAPQLCESPSSNISKRTVAWADDLSANNPNMTHALRVLPIPIAKILESLRTSNEIEIAQTLLPEVINELNLMAHL